LENTEAAFAHALSLGYVYLETDVHVTSDGVLLAFHDDVLDRVTDQLGSVASQAYAEISRARIGGHGRIPTLRELLEAFPQARFNVDVKARGVQRVFDPVPRILIEPGRSLVGNAGVTAYEIGTVKEIPSVRTYLSVDGGMSDNLRPMLYGSRYEAIVANRPGDEPGTLATVAGMHCESGDILITEVMLADPRAGDILVTPATGAYGYAMASNYNGVPRPAVVFCRNGDARLVVRRETYEDLIARDVE
jgi:diaminopimelate decarboxylase